MVQMADDADKMLQVFAGPCARGLSMSGVPMMPCLLHPCRIRVSRSRSSGEALAAQVGRSPLSRNRRGGSRVGESVAATSNVAERVREALRETQEREEVAEKQRGRKDETAMQERRGGRSFPT